MKADSSDTCSLACERTEGHGPLSEDVGPRERGGHGERSGAGPGGVPGAGVGDRSCPDNRPWVTWARSVFGSTAGS